MDNRAYGQRVPVQIANDFDHLVKGVPIHCIVKVKPNHFSLQEDLRLSQNRIGVMGVNNRVEEEYDVREVYAPNTSTSVLFNESFPVYIRAAVEGVNISIFMYGSTGSGKTHTLEGKNGDDGLVNLVSESLFNILEEKRY